MARNYLTVSGEDNLLANVRQQYHSIHARGENVENVLKESEEKYAISTSLKILHPFWKQ